ncbi:MAG: DUF423 domain-containing protein [Flavobacteriales bacterium]|nr:DUF423 domain-containing protein [Flavobacteriales bacterium]
MRWGAGVLLMAVALGAYGAHGLREHVDDHALTTWHTGVTYQFYHGLGLLLLAALSDRLHPRTVRWVRVLFLLGILCFSGSIYLLCTRDWFGTQALAHAIGPVTPLGGLLLMAGWTVLLFSRSGRTDQR